MENLQPNEVPEIDQPDLFPEIAPPKPRREAVVIPLFEKEPEDNGKACEICSGPGCPQCGFGQGRLRPSK